MSAPGSLFQFLRRKVAWWSWKVYGNVRWYWWELKSRVRHVPLRAR